MKEFEQKVKDGEEKAASLGPELVEKVLECAKFKKARKQRLLNISTKQERNLFRDRSSNIGGVDEERCDPCLCWKTKIQTRGLGLCPWLPRSSFQKMLSVKTRLVRFPNRLRQLGKHWPYLPRKQM